MEGGAEAKKEEEVKDEKKVRWPDFNAGVDFDRRRFQKNMRNVKRHLFVDGIKCMKQMKK